MVRRLVGRLCRAFAGLLVCAALVAPATAQPTAPAGALTSLFLLSDAKSREIGPENLTGQPGMGGRTELKDGSAKYAAKDLGRGWKVNPYIVVPPGKTITLGDAKGPGVINHIWMTLGGAADYRSVILRIYWDGEATPSVEVPAGDFFAAGWGRGFEPVVNSATVAVNPGSGFNSFWQMPFRKAARLTLENRSATRSLTIYYAIDYSETAVPAKAGYFHAQFRMGKADPATGDYTLLDGVKGQGQYVGTYLRHEAFSPGWWGEGEAKFYIDGDKAFPTIAGTGEEDYFLGSYSYQRKTAQGGRVETSYSAAYSGFLSVQDQPIDADYLKPGDRRYGEYRWHILDPIRFRRDLKVTIQNLGWKGVTPSRFIGDGTYLPLHDDLSSVAYWYQAEPHAPFPALPNDAALNDLPKPPAQ